MTMIRNYLLVETIAVAANVVLVVGAPAAAAAAAAVAVATKGLVAKPQHELEVVVVEVVVVASMPTPAALVKTGGYDDAGAVVHVKECPPKPSTPKRPRLPLLVVVADEEECWQPRLHP